MRQKYAIFVLRRADVRGTSVETTLAECFSGVFGAEPRGCVPRSQPNRSECLVSIYKRKLPREDTTTVYGCHPTNAGVGAASGSAVGALFGVRCAEWSLSLMAEIESEPKADSRATSV